MARNSGRKPHPTKPAIPNAIPVAPEIQFTAVAASGLYDGVEETRALFLSREYLVDIFQAAQGPSGTVGDSLVTLNQLVERSRVSASSASDQ